jgi:hypothetical protein
MERRPLCKAPIAAPLRFDLLRGTERIGCLLCRHERMAEA